MKHFILILSLLSTTFVGKGQNLVPNGDFEGYSGCPNYISQLDSALFWFNPTNATPDYYNQCSNPSLSVGVPTNFMGFQFAHSGGGYAGFFCYGGGPDYREYCEVPLLSALVANECYHLEMYINLANDAKYATDAIGAYFSDTLFTNFSTWDVLTFVPQINNSTGFITDTLNWSLVFGNYTAIGGENYLIIGNFKDDINTNLMTANLNGGALSYVYIDDVSLSPCTGIEEHNQQSEITIYPNPAKEELIVNSHLSLGKNEINIYDMEGRKVLQTIINNQSSIINIQSLKSGMYFIEINGVRKKFIKQ